MNKLMKKILGLTLGLAMSVGVGVAVGANEAVPARAADEELAFHFTGSSLATGTTYQSWSGSVSSSTTSKVSTATWQITVGNNSAQLGTNAKNTNLSKTTLGNGNFSAASGVANALSISTTTQKYAAVYCTTGMSNITKGELIFTGTNGGNITQAWLLSSTNGTSWTIESTKTKDITSGSTFSVTKSSTEKQFAFVCYWNLTNAGGLKGFEYKLYGEYDQTGTITASADSVYSDESVTLTTNATSATWSITSGSSYASLSSETGKSVNLIGIAPGSVTVKAVASGYTDATKTVTFNERPVGTYYDVTFNSNGGSLNPARQSIKENETFYFPSAGTKTHYTFLGWSSDGGTTKYAVGAESPAVTANIEYTAYWQEVSKYTVTYKAGPNGLGEFPDPGIYAGSYTLKEFTELTGVSANSGYRFKNYTVAGVEKNAGDSIIISEAIEVTVNFEVMPRVDTLDRKFTGVSSGSTSYTAWTGKTGVSGAVYAGQSAGGNDSIQLRSTSPAGIITTTSGGTVKKITVVWQSQTASDRTIDIYGKNTAYTESANLYASAEATKGTKLGSIVYGTSTELTVTGDYEYIGIRSNNGALYLSEIQIEWEAPNQLSSIALSGDYKTSFASGETFSFGGIVTAKYTKASDANVTSSATFHLDSASGTSMSGVKLTHASHDGHTIYVKYTENDITRTATYEISVANAPVSSVTIETHAAGIGFKEDYSIEDITPTVLPADAVQTTEWVVSANTVSNDYKWNGTKLTSGETQGTITLRCRSTADNSKYDELVVTVTGDPVVDITPASVSGYVEKSVDVDYTYGNIDNVELINFASSDESVFTVGDHIEDSGEGLVTIYFEGAGSATLSVSYNGGSTLDSITVTVSTDSVATLTWSAPTIKVYSGAITTVSDASSWNVHYTMASGGEGDLSYGEYTLKLGGSSITLPHTWDASEDGKVLSIEYGGFASPTTSTVDVTQSLRPVNVPVPGEESTKTWTATDKANFGSTIANVGETDSGSVTFDDDSTMSYERTLEYLASGKADYLAFTSNYIQFGSSNALEKLVLTAAISGTVTSVVVDCWAKDGGSNISVTVGGSAFDSSKACPSSGKEVTFNGSATGAVVITMEKSTKTAGLAQYIKSVAITTAEDSGETTNIANVAGHEAAQKAVVAFAKAFNTALGATENCTTGLDAAWSTATTAWSTFNSDIESLSADEQTYAKNLIKYATAQHTKDTDDNFEYCLERAMATYEICVTKHGKTAFMNDVRSASPVVNKNILESMTSGSTIAIVVVSVLAVTAIGGYFFLRKRKELN